MSGCGKRGHRPGGSSFLRDVKSWVRGLTPIIVGCSIHASQQCYNEHFLKTLRSGSVRNQRWHGVCRTAVESREVLAVRAVLAVTHHTPLGVELNRRDEADGETQ